MLFQRRKQALGRSRAAQTTRRLHTVHALLRGRAFEGQFEARGAAYNFSFAPASAALSRGKLVLSGRVGVGLPAGGTRWAEGVEARLAATQGGVGTSPVRRQLLTGTAQTGQIATPEQKLEQEKGPETELQPGLHAFEKPKNDEQGRPVVESTGPQSFVGVLYFHLSPLDARTLGVPLDLSRVQLNARLAPTNELGRDFQAVFSALVAALYGERADEREASEQVRTLNRLLQAGGDLLPDALHHLREL
jgi:hypothetical protein